MLKEISSPLKSSINRSTNCTSNYRSHSAYKSPNLRKSNKFYSNNISKDLYNNLLANKYKTIKNKQKTNNNNNKNKGKFNSSDFINTLLSFYTLKKANNKFKNLLNNDTHQNMAKKLFENENEIKNIKKKKFN